MERTEINRFVMFGYNYPHDFIEQIWGSTCLVEHLKAKFLRYYDDYGASAVLVKFYVELDARNQKKLEDWILHNYKG